MDSCWRRLKACLAGMTRLIGAMKLIRDARDSESIGSRQKHLRQKYTRQKTFTTKTSPAQTSGEAARPQVQTGPPTSDYGFWQTNNIFC